MIRFATVGTSWITEDFLCSLKLLPQAEAVACYSRKEERGRRFGEKHGIPLVFDDLEAMAASPEIDAVYIASPNGLHYSQARLFLTHGKHVLCEKPAAVSPRQQEELWQLSLEKGAVYMEALIGLHLPAWRVLQEALREIGPIVSARLDFSQYSSKYPAYLRGELPNIFDPRLCTGALMDLGVYCCSLAVGLWGCGGCPARYRAAPIFYKAAQTIPARRCCNTQALPPA